MLSLSNSILSLIIIFNVSPSISQIGSQIVQNMLVNSAQKCVGNIRSNLKYRPNEPPWMHAYTYECVCVCICVRTPVLLGLQMIESHFVSLPILSTIHLKMHFTHPWVFSYTFAIFIQAILNQRMIQEMKKNTVRKICAIFMLKCLLKNRISVPMSWTNQDEFQVKKISNIPKTL